MPQRFTLESFENVDGLPGKVAYVLHDYPGTGCPQVPFLAVDLTDDDGLAVRSLKPNPVEYFGDGNQLVLRDPRLQCMKGRGVTAEQSQPDSGSAALIQNVQSITEDTFLQIYSANQEKSTSNSDNDSNTPEVPPETNLPKPPSLNPAKEIYIENLSSDVLTQLDAIWMSRRLVVDLTEEQCQSANDDGQSNSYASEQADRELSNHIAPEDYRDPEALLESKQLILKGSVNTDQPQAFVNQSGKSPIIGANLIKETSDVGERGEASLSTVSLQTTPVSAMVCHDKDNQQLDLPVHCSSNPRLSRHPSQEPSKNRPTEERSQVDPTEKLKDSETNPENESSLSALKTSGLLSEPVAMNSKDTESNRTSTKKSQPSSCVSPSSSLTQTLTDRTAICQDPLTKGSLSMKNMTEVQSVSIECPASRPSSSTPPELEDTLTDPSPSNKTAPCASPSVVSERQNERPSVGLKRSLKGGLPLHGGTSKTANVAPAPKKTKPNEPVETEHLKMNAVITTAPMTVPTRDRSSTNNARVKTDNESPGTSDTGLRRQATEKAIVPKYISEGQTIVKIDLKRLSAEQLLKAYPPPKTYEYWRMLYEKHDWAAEIANIRRRRTKSSSATMDNVSTGNVNVTATNVTAGDATKNVSEACTQQAIGEICERKKVENEKIDKLEKESLKEIDRSKMLTQKNISTNNVNVESNVAKGYALALPSSSLALHNVESKHSGSVKRGVTGRIQWDRCPSDNPTVNRSNKEPVINKKQSDRPEQRLESKIQLKRRKSLDRAHDEVAREPKMEVQRRSCRKSMDSIHGNSPSSVPRVTSSGNALSAKKRGNQDNCHPKKSIESCCNAPLEPANSTPSPMLDLTAYAGLSTQGRIEDRRSRFAALKQQEASPRKILPLRRSSHPAVGVHRLPAVVPYPYPQPVLISKRPKALTNTCSRVEVKTGAYPGSNTSNDDEKGNTASATLNPRESLDGKVVCCNVLERNDSEAPHSALSPAKSISYISGIETDDTCETGSAKVQDCLQSQSLGGLSQTSVLGTRTPLKPGVAEVLSEVDIQMPQPSKSTTTTLPPLESSTSNQIEEPQLLSSINSSKKNSKVLSSKSIPCCAPEWSKVNDRENATITVVAKELSNQVRESNSIVTQPSVITPSSSTLSDVLINVNNNKMSKPSPMLTISKEVIVSSLKSNYETSASISSLAAANVTICDTPIESQGKSTDTVVVADSMTNQIANINDSIDLQSLTTISSTSTLIDFVVTQPLLPTSSKSMPTNVCGTSTVAAQPMLMEEVSSVNVNDASSSSESSLATVMPKKGNPSVATTKTISDVNVELASKTNSDGSSQPLVKKSGSLLLLTSSSRATTTDKLKFTNEASAPAVQLTPMERVDTIDAFNTPSYLAAKLPEKRDLTVVATTVNDTEMVAESASNKAISRCCSKVSEPLVSTPSASTIAEELTKMGDASTIAMQPEPMKRLGDSMPAGTPAKRDQITSLPTASGVIEIIDIPSSPESDIVEVDDDDGSIPVPKPRIYDVELDRANPDENLLVNSRKKLGKIALKLSSLKPSYSSENAFIDKNASGNSSRTSCSKTSEVTESIVVSRIVDGQVINISPDATPVSSTSGEQQNPRTSQHEGTSQRQSLNNSSNEEDQYAVHPDSTTTKNASVKVLPAQEKPQRLWPRIVISSEDKEEGELDDSPSRDQQTQRHSNHSRDASLDKRPVKGGREEAARRSRVLDGPRFLERRSSSHLAGASPYSMQSGTTLRDRQGEGRSSKTHSSKSRSQNGRRDGRSRQTRQRLSGREEALFRRSEDHRAQASITESPGRSRSSQILEPRRHSQSSHHTPETSGHSRSSNHIRESPVHSRSTSTPPCHRKSSRRWSPGVSVTHRLRSKAHRTRSGLIRKDV